MKKLLLAFQQVGGANALLPAIEEWGCRYEVIVTGRDLVCDNLRKRGIPVSYYHELGTAQDTITADPAWFENLAPDMVITDTIDLARTPGGRACRDFWSLARDHGLPSTAYVDCWWGYDKRFRFPNENTSPILPDQIALIDDLARNDIIAAGFPEDLVVVLGSPKFEGLSQLARIREERKKQLRVMFGADEEKMLLVFVSQPLEKTFGPDNRYGFTERTTLLSVLAAIEKYPPALMKMLKLTVLLHPEENMDVLGGVVEEKAKILDIDIRKEQAPYDLIMAADLVIGMSSILLVEAAIMKVPVLSVQLDSKEEEILITNLTGATLSINNSQQLSGELHRAITEKAYRDGLVRRQSEFGVVTDSSMRWSRFLTGFLGP